MTPSAYPLQWPADFRRGKSTDKGQFRSSLQSALANVQKSLRGFAADSSKPLGEVIISSNCSLGNQKPSDPGVAVWFTWDAMGLCIAVDRYSTVEANLQAIHHIIEARRVELRHGTLALVKATFRGFLALPSSSKRAWWDVLGITRDCVPDALQSRYRELARKHHPDAVGGDYVKMAGINEAYEEAKKALNIA